MLTLGKKHFSSPDIIKRMTKLSYGDMIVIRWSSTFDQSKMLRGLTNRSYNFDQLKALGFWKDFQLYFQMTKRLIEANPDPIDLGLVSGLAIITSDRDLFKLPDRCYIYPIQEHLARLLKAKCDLQGNDDNKFDPSYNDQFRKR